MTSTFVPTCPFCQAELPVDDRLMDEHVCGADQAPAEETAADSAVLADALRYAAAGRYVFPVRVEIVEGKKRVGPVADWRNASTTSAEQIRRWFGPGQPWEGASVAIDCGRSGLVVVDPDGADGIARWDALVAEHRLPATHRVGTPGGGQHWYYREHPRRVVGNDSTGKVAPGVDVRGLGGFVIAPPSTDDRGSYRWLEGEPEWSELPVVPDLVVERMNVKAEKSAGGDRPRADRTDEARTFTREQAAAFVQPHVDALRNAAAGSINNLLNNAAKVFSHFVPTFWDEEQVYAILRDALASTDYDGKTWKADATIASGLTYKPGDWVAGLIEQPGPAAGGSVDEEGFWTARRALRTIRATARERLVSPWAVLGAVLALVCSRVGPHVVLPPIVGGRASLNTFWAMVGASGSGKDAAIAVGRDLLWLDYAVPIHEVGTGQGIDSSYTMQTNKKGPVQFCDAALFTISEIDTLTAHSKMAGSTVMATLRKVYTGAALGARYADKEKRRPVREHHYRAAVIAGVQPARAGVLLDDADGGTPQRWLWLPTNDPGAAEWRARGDGLGDTITEPGGLWQEYEYLSARGELSEQDVELGQSIQLKTRIEIKVCESARAAVVAQREARLAGGLVAADGLRDLAAHALLTRLKVAALLATFDGGRAEITEEDWELSSVIMAVSDATRAVCADALTEMSRKANVAKALRDVEREDVAEASKEKRVAQALLRILTRAGDWVTRAELRNRRMATRDKPYFEAAMARLLSAGSVEVSETEPGHGPAGERYRAVR